MTNNSFYIRMMVTLVILTLNSFLSVAQERPYVKVFFENSKFDDAFFESKVEYSGSSWIENIQSKIPISNRYVFTPKNALKLNYISSQGGNWSALVNYDKIRGMDFFKPADHLSFWLYINSSKENNAFPKINLVTESRNSTSSLNLKNYLQNSTQEWQRIFIPLKEFSQNISIQDITGIQFSQGESSKKLTELYIDQIELVSKDTSSITSQKPQLISATGYERHIDLSWHAVKDSTVHYVSIYRSSDDGKHFENVGVQSPWINGFSDFVDTYGNTQWTYKIAFLNTNYEINDFSSSLSAQTKKLSDEELLDMVQHSNFRYYWEGCEPNSGLALENVPGRTTMIATGASGFGIMAIIAGVHRNFITRDKAVQHFLKITRFLKTADRFHGVFPHFLNGETGKTVAFFGNKDNGGDLVETSFLMQGLLTAQQFFDGTDTEESEIRNTIQTLWEEVEWDWYRKTNNGDFLFWHWSPDQEWAINHKLIGWNETLITYFLAIASPTHAVPASLYYSGWASPSVEAQNYRSDWGKTTDGSMYTNGNTYYGIELPVGVSNGGPLFFVHYSFLGLNPHKLTDAYVNYFENNQKIAEINLRYCIENPENHQDYGSDFWGLTASDGPAHYSANEPNPRNDEGKMTATGALASFPYTPDASLAALKNYYINYGDMFYGYYGFHDAIALDEKWISPLYMGLNQAPITVMIENYRSGLLWDLFMKNNEIKNTLKELQILTKKIKR